MSILHTGTFFIFRIVGILYDLNGMKCCKEMVCICNINSE